MIEIKPNSLFPNSLSREEGFLKTDPSGFSSNSRCYGEGRFLLDLCTKRCTKQRCHHFDRGVLLEELRRGLTKVLRRRVGWTSVPRIAYDIVPPTLRGFVRFTFSSIACLPSRRSSQLSVPFPTR